MLRLRQDPALFYRQAGSLTLPLRTLYEEFAPADGAGLGTQDSHQASPKASYVRAKSARPLR